MSQKLSERIYEHQRRAAELADRGRYAEAAAQQRQAQQEIEKLGRLEASTKAPINALAGVRR
jgi:hypothetical protein